MAKKRPPPYVNMNIEAKPLAPHASGQRREIRVTPEQVMTDGLIGVPEVMKLLDCGKTVVYDMLKSGLLPFVKVRSVRKIPRAAVSQYILNNLVQN